jgi:ferritin-like metal-binding protein YciE
MDGAATAVPGQRENRLGNGRCASARCRSPYCRSIECERTEEKMMTAPKEHLIDWLRNAYAMEKQAESMLKAQASRLEHYPRLKTRIEQHLDETLSQQKLLEGCLDRLGSSPSTIEDLAARIAAMGQAVGGMTVSDEVVKGAMAGYVFEQFEVASYTTLIAAAKAAGDAETQRCCETILPQEVEMGRWLLEHMPEVVTAFLARSGAGQDAKR